MAMTWEKLVESIHLFPEMTSDQRREQYISFAYGNVNCDRAVPIPREVFEEAYDKLFTENSNDEKEEA